MSTGDIVSKALVLLLWGLFWVVAFPIMVVLKASESTGADH